MKRSSKPFWAGFVFGLTLSGCVTETTHQVVLTELDRAQAQMTELGKQNQLLDKKLSKQAELLVSDRQKLKDLDKHNQTQRLDLELLSKRNHELLTELANLNRNKDDLLDMTEAQKLEIEAQRLEIETQKLEIEAQKLELEKRARQSLKLEGQLKGMDSLRAEVDALDLLTRNLSNELEEYRSRVEELDQSKEKTHSRLSDIHNRLGDALQQEIQNDEIVIEVTQKYLKIRLHENLLFDSGPVDMKVNGMKILDHIGKILNDTGDVEIEIQGHTDSVPIGPRLADRFPTNWELSTARASRVVRYFLDEADILHSFLSAKGLGDTHPIADNATPEGRALNRRIEIVLFPSEFKDSTQPGTADPAPVENEVNP